MQISFSDKKLATLANDDRRMVKELGQIRAKIFRRRLTQLEGAFTLEDLRNVPGNYHELVQNRKGQWSCDLDQPYRLIFEPQENPIPTDKSGKYIWIEITSINITEIVDYH